MAGVVKFCSKLLTKDILEHPIFVWNFNAGCSGRAFTSHAVRHWLICTDQEMKLQSNIIVKDGQFKHEIDGDNP